jgi:hypothetical protein
MFSPEHLTSDQHQDRGGSGKDEDGPRIDAQTARAWLDAQLARQGITSPTITNRNTLRKLATLFYTGLDDPRSSASPSSERPKGRTRGRTAGERRSGQ